MKSEKRSGELVEGDDMRESEREEENRRGRG